MPDRIKYTPPLTALSKFEIDLHKCVEKFRTEARCFTTSPKPSYFNLYLVDGYKVFLDEIAKLRCDLKSLNDNDCARATRLLNEAETKCTLKYKNTKERYKHFDKEV